MDLRGVIIIIITIRTIIISRSGGFIEGKAKQSKANQVKPRSRSSDSSRICIQKSKTEQVGTEARPCSPWSPCGSAL